MILKLKIYKNIVQHIIYLNNVLKQLKSGKINNTDKIKNKIKTKNSKKFIRKKCKKILKMNNKIK